jgi:hypothetical protein
MRCGTALRVDDEQTILYTRGSVDFFRTSVTNDCAAAALPRCSSLNTVDWIPNEITAAARQRTLQAGESLFHQGDQTYGIFAIVKGRVQMIRYDSHGRALVLFTARARGDVTANAPGGTQYPLGGPILLSLLRRDPTAAQKFIALDKCGQSLPSRPLRRLSAILSFLS